MKQGIANDAAIGPARPWTCREAATGLREGQARAGRRILAGVCTTEHGHCIAAYGDTQGDVDALPATFRGFRVVPEVLSRHPRAGAHAVR